MSTMSSSQASQVQDLRNETNDESGKQQDECEKEGSESSPLTTAQEERQNRNDKNEEKMTLKDAIILIVFGIGLPTLDIYSDLVFSLRLIFGTCDGWTCRDRGTRHPIYGSMMLIPIAFSTIFHLPHWWRTEGTTKKRLLTLPLLLLQV